jgi:hypothetical protein
MRRQDHIVKLKKRMVFHRRLILNDVERRSCDFLLLERSVKGVFVDNAAASGIDQVCRRFHQSELLFADHPLGFRSQGAVDRHEVRFGQQLGQFHPFASQGCHMGFRNVRIMN